MPNPPAPERPFVETQSTKLYALARNIAHHPDAAQVDKWDSELARLTEKHLRAGQNSVFIRAFEKAADDDPAFDRLAAIVEQSASTRVLGFKEDGRYVQGTLIAIPVLLTTAGEMQGGTLPPGPRFQGLTRSLRQAGLLGEEASVALVNYLYRATELFSIPYSQVACLTARVWHIACGRREPTPQDLFQEHPQGVATGDAGDSTLQLRYLLGIVVDDIDRASPLQPEGLDQAELAARAAAFCGSVEDQVADMLGLPASKVAVSRPAAFFSALGSGYAWIRDLGLAKEFAQALEEHKVAPLGVSAVVTANGDQTPEELRIYIESRLDGELLMAYAYPVTDVRDAGESSARISAMLHQQGVGLVHVAEGLLLPLDDDEQRPRFSVMEPFFDGARAAGSYASLEDAGNGNARTTPTLH